ncbi:MAG: hypothetical protein R2856_23250 [Caldilineaceae bacterium]
MITQSPTRFVLVDRTRTTANAPDSAQYARDVLLAALAEAHVAVSVQQHLPDAAPELTLVIGPVADQLVQRLLHVAGVDIAAQPEGVIFQHCRLAQARVLVIAGADARGLVYALLEAADTVRHEGLDALVNIANSFESADLRVRGLDRFIMGPLDDAWFYDDEFWRYYLDRLVHARFNRFTLVAGFDTAYLSPPYPYFVDTPGYAHVHVTGLDAGGRVRNLAQLRRIGQACRRREIDFFLATWQQTPWTDNQQRQVAGLPDDEAGLSAYCAAGLKTLLQQCPELDGVQLRVNHESGVGTQESNEAFWLMLIDAVAECGRPVQLDLRAKGLTNGMIQRALAGGVQLTLPTKYWCEQTGLPHHLTQMRREELTQLGNLNHSRRYSYSDLLRKPHWYDMLYRLWTLGSTTLFAWGDPDYVRRFVASCRVGQAAGFTVAAPLSMKGGHASIQGDPWPIFADTALQSGRWEDERHWLFYLLYGRIGYSAQACPGLATPVHQPFRCSRRSVGRKQPHLRPHLAPGDGLPHTRASDVALLARVVHRRGALCRPQPQRTLQPRFLRAGLSMAARTERSRAVLRHRRVRRSRGIGPGHAKYTPIRWRNGSGACVRGAQGNHRRRSTDQAGRKCRIPGAARRSEHVGRSGRLSRLQNSRCAGARPLPQRR